eukprot:CAMPEP_0204587362 /NCGR_PEP_ID=MMETSP0661-20131031/48011_1 /ASSEMBLY_ACC=CAM_ASM_000606 /TAXON_ID=109239 /ORGANISM="Alexandrium margalefi, Strain AMGDE01CS-322" /LENGTH=47 /DNA_ID= /DNA_START= /DNA_END= /DNA_ORIENTATION=
MHALPSSSPFRGKWALPANSAANAVGVSHVAVFAAPPRVQDPCLGGA